jgi:hypothetical protein
MTRTPMSGPCALASNLYEIHKLIISFDLEFGPKTLPFHNSTDLPSLDFGSSISLPIRIRCLPRQHEALTLATTRDVPQYAPALSKEFMH